MNLEKYLETLEMLVNTDSGTGDIEGCHKMVEYFYSQFLDAGFQSKVYKEGVLNPYVEGRYYGRDSKDDTIDILFMGHLDTVFDKGTAKDRPYSVKGQRAYGPGVADMKDGALLALEIARQLSKEKAKVNLCIAFNSDEETGSASSEKWIKELGSKSKYSFNFEPARANGEFVKERKGVYDYYIDFNGVASHAGVAPEKGASAVTEMGHWIMALLELAKPQMGTTLNPGVVKGGSASNVVAASASLVIDLRYTKEEERERIERAFDEMAKSPKVKGVTTTWHRGDGFPPMGIGPKTADLIELMEKVADELGQKKPEFVSTGGGSDSNNLGGFDVTAIDGCGPIGDEYHSEKEYMEMDSILPRYELILETIRKIENEIQ